MKLSHNASAISPFVFAGNQLWLDFVNTEIVSHGQRADLLDSFVAFAAWLKAAHVFGESEIDQIERDWSDASKQRRAHDQIRALRGVLRDLAGQLTHGRPVPDGAVAAVNATLRHRTGYPQLVPTATGYERMVYGEITTSEHLLAPIAESVTDFLCQSDWSLLKHCENPACVLYFYDTTKNHARRWCSMSGCGNRMKAAAHYRRAKAAKEGVKS